MLAVVDENKEYLFLLHNRNNPYSRDGHEVPVANNARIYSTIKDLSVGDARVIEETGPFPDSSIKINNALTWSKKKRVIKCEVRSLDASLQSTTFASFTKKMMSYL